MPTKRTLSRTERDLLARGLPKWPQMRLLGTRVTADQAKEIIRRTDTVFRQMSGNDTAFIHLLIDMLRYPRHKNDEDDGLWGTWATVYKQQDIWLKRWGYIDTEYVRNSWVSSGFVYGPHGWCHPNGTLEYIYNVGSWPNGKALYNDWSLLAREFPFLDIDITLMSGTDCTENTVPVFGMTVREGVVRVVDPATTTLRQPTTVADENYNLFQPCVIRNHKPSYECALSLDTLLEYSDRAKTLWDGLSVPDNLGEYAEYARFRMQQRLGHIQNMPFRGLHVMAPCRQ